MKYQLLQCYILALQLIFGMAEYREPTLVDTVINFLMAKAVKHLKALGWKRFFNSTIHWLYPVFQSLRMVTEL